MTHSKQIILVTAAGLASVGTTLAGEVMTSPAPVPMVEEPAGPAVSGSLGLDYNSHFISYGADIWGAGSSLDDALFNPSVELSWDLGGGFSASLGTWWDVNDNLKSDLGGNLQEIDVWAGIGWESGPVSVSLTYQAWFYGSETEQIVDLGLGYDAPLAPSLTIHGRVDEGASGGDTGVVVVPGIDLAAVGEGIALGPVEVSLPISVAFASDGFHGGDSGFAYASAGIGLSLPLAGGWDLHTSATYYFTDDDVIPGNVDDSFVTVSAGLGFSF